MEFIDIVKLVDNVVASGGHFGVVIVCFFAWRAIQNAALAVRHLQSIDEQLSALRAEQNKDFGAVKERLQDIEIDLARIDARAATHG